MTAKPLSHHPPPPRRPAAARQGFTLVELLVVIAIILLVAALVIPVTRNMAGGVNLTAAGEEISSALSLARQRATSLSRNTALRFYPSGSASNAPFKSYQLWEQEDTANAASWKAVDKEQPLPTGLIVDPDPAFSPILNLAKGTDAQGRKFSAIQFAPSGGITAPKDQACLTLHSELPSKRTGAVTGLPPNFAVINIEPFNGRPRTYRP